MSVKLNIQKEEKEDKSNKLSLVELDREINKAERLKKLKNYPEYKDFKEIFDLIQKKAFDQMMDETIPENKLLLLRNIYKAIVYWNSMVDSIIADGEVQKNQRLELVKAEQDRLVEKIKRGNPYKT